MKIVVQGAAQVADVPGLAKAEEFASLAFAPDGEALANVLPGADVLLGWNFRGRDLADQWYRAGSLKWIQWCGAGVDAVLFPELSDSDVVLTNARGLFDRAMAEYALAYMLAEAKGFFGTRDAQARREWSYRHTPKLAGSIAAVYGVGSIGREIARILSAIGVEVVGVGRTARSGDPDFGTIHGRDEAHTVARRADWVIGILPSTSETTGYFDAAFFTAMKPGARFINMGRGNAVEDQALLNVLETGAIAGAMLDVFHTEPLPEDNPLWGAPNLFVSPHMSGDYIGHTEAMVDQFLANLERYAAGQPLDNVVDKKMGFVRG